MFMKPDQHAIDTPGRMALLEDAPWGDLTSEALLPTNQQISAQFVARVEGVFCGEDGFSSAMSLSGPVVLKFIKPNPESFSAGDVLANLSGPVKAILRA